MPARDDGISEPKTTTIRANPATVRKLREFARHKRETNEELFAKVVDFAATFRGNFDKYLDRMEELRRERERRLAAEKAEERRKLEEFRRKHAIEEKERRKRVKLRMAMQGSNQAGQQQSQSYSTPHSIK